jgi:hypothetical protein
MRKPRKAQTQFAVCIKNKGYEASLEVGKLYRVVPDQQAERHGYLRIIDESGEDYGYAASRFFSIDIPKPLERALVKAAS